MTIAQCKAARHRFTINFHDVGKIGRSVYPRALAEGVSARREAAFRERQKKTAGRKKK